MQQTTKLCMALLLVLGTLALATRAYALPNINQPQQKTNYVEQLDKSYFQPPELEQTIDEVQKILANDPALPRLTRGEIEELYEKVTREEYEKSIEAGDMSRADSMRALMLVLPYNTDNNTEENLQELYTRPPVTRVIDGYTPPEPIRFLTPDPSSAPHTDSISHSNLDATTYKPAYPLKSQLHAPNPTTYHPQPPPVMYQMTPSLPKPSMGFQPVTMLPAVYDYAAGVVANLDASTAKPPAAVQRFSSHYNAKNAEFLRKPKPPATATTTVKPVADILESLGIVGQTRNRYVAAIDDYYPAESAPKPVISSYVPQTASLADLRSAQIKPDAYTNFKPLNIGEELRVKPEVEGYLTRFGIVKKSSKAIKKSPIQSQNLATKDEPAIGESEIATAKVPTAQRANNNLELAKLLVNLQELERLQTKTPKRAHTTPRSTTTTSSTTTTTTTTTTSTTTPKPPPATTPVPTANLITNGAPLLIEPKKPRRRIDPNIDINFAASGNHQQIASNSDQLTKLLENLQELERLKVSPADVALVTTTPAPTTTTTTTTPPPLPAASTQTLSLTNRFSQPQPAPTAVTRDAQDLQFILKQLQQLEQANAARKLGATTTTTTTTTSTTRRPSHQGLGLGLGLGLGNSLAANELLQLQRLLSDDRELERLYEQARNTKKAAKPTSSSTTPTTPTSTTTTKKPGLDIGELQAYLAQLDRATRPSVAALGNAISSSSTTSKPQTADLLQRIGSAPKAKPTVDHAQFEALISRVQQLEQLNSQQGGIGIGAAATTISPGYLGFTTRNVQAPARGSPLDYRLPANDFAQLQQLYQQLPNAQHNFGIEISTAATAAKRQPQPQAQPQTHTQSQLRASYQTGTAQGTAKASDDLATRIFELTNETGSGGNLQDVDPNDYVQLQKLLSKVQELERVKITPNEQQGNSESTAAPNLVTAASIRTQNVKSLNGAQIVYAVPSTEPTKAQQEQLELAELQLDLPVYNRAHSHKKASVLAEQTSSEELRALAMSQPANPRYSVLDKDFEQYQQFFSSLEDNERISYQNMQPQKTMAAPATATVTKEPPRFVATKKPPQPNAAKKQKDLEELQKLLYNAQELKKLGVALPNELSQQLETKLAQSTTTKTTTTTTAKTTTTPETTPTTTASTATTTSDPRISDGLAATIVRQTDSSTAQATTVRGAVDSSSPAVFSLTTTKPLVPREPKPTTESNIDLPVFSATKIIEAAIKRAANKIGVSTEQTLGFRRRSDENVAADDMLPADDAGDLMAEFSEINYQLAMPPGDVGGVPAAPPPLPPAVHIVTPEPQQQAPQAAAALGGDLNQLQRLISNLQELQKLNVSASQQMQAQHDAAYLASLKQQGAAAETTKKDRRQSEVQASGSTPAALADETTTQAPTRISLNLGLDNEGSSNGNDDSDSSGGNAMSASVAATTTTTSTPAPSDDSASDESRNGSLADLEDSFGPNPITQEPPPPKKKNGFYFLADWNSFLEVGVGDSDDQVVVRLSPKIGDPRLFLPVKVP